MRIVYITAQTPWGEGESFILPEVMEILRRGHTIQVIPLRPRKALGSDQLALQASKSGAYLPLFGLRTLSLAIVEFLQHPAITSAAIGDILRDSGSIRTSLKNLAVLPKSLAIARMVRKFGADHIHTHWASTPATAGYIAAKFTGKKWSFTAHRWDIAENNMLRAKAATAEFVRAISENGKAELVEAVGEKLAAKCKVIHMGVDLDSSTREDYRESRKKEHHGNGSFILACPANLVQVKGHQYLIDACRILKERDRNLACLLFGDGPLKNELRRQVAASELTQWVKFMGRVPQGELFKHYAQGLVQAVVVPSIITETGEKEGIPVSLIEAMAYEIPVISTATGSTHELLANDAGLLVPEKQAQALADAVEELIDNPEERTTLARTGRARVIEEFDVRSVVQILLTEIGAEPATAKNALLDRHV